MTVRISCPRFRRCAGGSSPWCLPTSGSGRSNWAPGDCATSSSPCSCCNWSTAATTSRCTCPPRSMRWRRWEPAATSAVTTPPTSPPPTSSSGYSSTGCNCSGSSAPTCCPRPRMTRPCAGWPGRPTCARTEPTMPSECCARNSSARASGCRKLHAKLFYQPLLESVGSSLGFTSGMSAEAAERQLAALGYEGPQSALTHLAALVNASGRRGTRAGGAAAAPAGLAVGHSRSRQRTAGLSADQRGAGRPPLVSRARCVTRARSPNG